ncbi:MAG TPA: DUF1918 domain-containing protein [Micromonosporaceae bacterium]|jgi:hypothetical protein
MKARPGDWLVVETSTVATRRRQGLITEVVGADGAPPFRVRWLDTDHVALVFPGADARVLTPEQHREQLREAVRFAAHPQAGPMP